MTLSTLLLGGTCDLLQLHHACLLPSLNFYYCTFQHLLISVSHPLIFFMAFMLLFGFCCGFRCQRYSLKTSVPEPNPCYLLCFPRLLTSFLWSFTMILYLFLCLFDRTVGSRLAVPELAIRLNLICCAYAGSGKRPCT